VKKFVTYLPLLTLSLLVLGEKMQAQTVSDSLLIHSPIYREKLHLFTDRSLYASGENIHFSLQNLSFNLLKENGWSKVVYLELISKHQIPVAQGKYQLDPHGAMGQLRVPDTVSSGAYQLRAYTKWMRNFEASDYFHLSLTLVNPRQWQGPEQESNAKQISFAESTASSKGLTCSTDKAIFEKREKGTLQINAQDYSSLREAYSISIARKGFLNLEGNDHPRGEKKDPFHPEEILYFPETRGASLSGRASQNEDSSSVSYLPFHITLLGTESDYFGGVSDKSGRIQFPLPPLTDQAELLISPALMNGEVPNLIFQEEFSQEIAETSFDSENLFTPENKLMDEMGLYSQVARPFKEASADRLNSEKMKGKHPFYGTPEFRYYTADYIEIPSLEEFISELVTHVQVEKHKGQRYFSVLDKAGPISEYPPLILVDFVPIPHAETVLSLVPDQIEYIDVINAIYIRGSNNYGGIISLISKKGDLAGIKLPEGSSIVSYHPLQISEEEWFYPYKPQKDNKRIPDLRTTIYWNARYSFSPENLNSIEFFTSDVSGEFMAVIRGISQEGELVQATCEFSVE
jgi:hypothetical protein